MTTSESAPSLHLQCLKNCLSEKLPCAECPSQRIILDSDSSPNFSLSSSPPSDPTKSPTNNNNNTTTSNSNPVHPKCVQEQNTVGSQSQNSFSSVSAPGVCGTRVLSSSSPCIINSTHTPVSNACCCTVGNQLSCSYNNCKSPSSTSLTTIGTVSSRPELASDEFTRISSTSSGCERALTQDCIISGGGPITENHLSTKNQRNKTVPYSIPNSRGGLVTQVKQNQDKSNHSQVNPSLLTTTASSSCTGPTLSGSSFIASSETCTHDEKDQVMFDNVSVNSIQQANNTGGVVTATLPESNHNNPPHLMSSTSLLSSGIITSVNSSTGGLLHSNNMVIKSGEPNGNSIELALDNQFHHHNHHHHVHNFHQHHGSNSGVGGDCCLSGNNSTTSGESFGIMQPHDIGFGAQHNNGNQNNQMCHNHNGLFVNPCAHNCGGGMSLATGNGSMGSISGNSNGGGSMSMTSPGGSLDEHDCDDDKVINGDITFDAGDLPDGDAIKMFVGQVPKHLSEPELRTLFEEFGRVFQINVLRDKATKQSKGCCFVTFYTRKSALDAQNALHNVKTLPGMNHPLQMKPADNENRYERKLFVGMISRKSTEADVRTMFSRFGVIDECTVLRDASQQSKGCAFITFASKQSAQNAIKAIHHSSTQEGCASPIVVKFADTQKDKDQKRQQTIQSTHMGNLSATAIAPMSQPQPFLSDLCKLEQILQQLQQPAQQQAQGYYSQLSPLGMGGLGGLGSLGGGGAMQGLGSSLSNSDLATIAARALSSNLNPNSQHYIVNLATLAALGNHSSLSPTEFTYAGANGCSLGSANALSIAGNGLQSGLSSFSGAIRSQPVANKQTEGPEGANLFIYHLPPECGDLDLAQMFATYGNVISAKVFVDKQTNLSKCFGFVSYDSPVSAQLAIQQMNGFQIGMKRLKVQLKRPKDAAKPY